MGLKVSGNSAVEAAITADQLIQGEIGKVVTVDNHVNARSGAVNKYLLRASKYDAQGGMVFTDGGPFVIQGEHLHHYRVVRMPKGFVLSLEVA